MDLARRFIQPLHPQNKHNPEAETQFSAASSSRAVNVAKIDAKQPLCNPEQLHPRNIIRVKTADWRFVSCLFIMPISEFGLTFLT